jgi:excisionase family DNA binding protein
MQGKVKARPRYLRPGEVAEALGVAPCTVSRWLASGRLPSVRLGAGGPRRVLESALEAFLLPGCDDGPEVEAASEIEEAVEEGVRAARRRGYDV